MDLGFTTVAQVIIRFTTATQLVISVLDYVKSTS